MTYFFQDFERDLVDLVLIFCNFITQIFVNFKKLKTTFIKI